MEASHSSDKNLSLPSLNFFFIFFSLIVKYLNYTVEILKNEYYLGIYYEIIELQLLLPCLLKNIIPYLISSMF